jgi:hypothetical protein
MPGLVPGIHVLSHEERRGWPGRGPGHDEEWIGGDSDARALEPQLLLRSNSE